ncbi:hypothetical protein LUZ60_002069 [Juncus effusus]|nr:hypothetical protein LUZ60_002069 [Juncus effusus]
MGSSTPASPKNNHNSSMCSPEFEFWGLSEANNPSTFPSVNLPSADELFSDGILLPLQTLNLSSPPNKSNPNSPHSLLDPCSNSFSTSTASPGPASKRWKDIFIKNGEKERRKVDQKTRLSIGNNAELNINIWPFSRSRSAGNASRARLPTWRNVSSAPCSRSNSRNAESSAPDGSVVEPNTASSMIKRWAQTGKLGPTVGIRVGRTGRVWQLRRNKQQQQQQQKQQQSSEAEDESDINGSVNEVKDLNLNVNACTGYRNKSSCSDDGSGKGNNGGMFSIKAIFSKKVY